MKIQGLGIKPLFTSLVRFCCGKAIAAVCSLLAIACFSVQLPIAPATAGQLPAQPTVVNQQINRSEANKAIALQFAVEGWGTNANWRQTWDELVADDVVYHFNSGTEPVVGLEANKAFNAELFDGFPDLHQTIETMIAEGDEVVYRSTLEGTHTGDFLGIEATGKPVKMNDFTLLRVVDGKITEWWYECNLLELMSQLGLS